MDRKIGDRPRFLMVGIEVGGVMPKWLVQLTGDKFDLEELPRGFTEPELQVIEESDGYYLTSKLFESAEEPEQVRTLALEMLQRLVGAATLLNSNFRPVELGSVVRQEKDGSRQRTVFLSEYSGDTLLNYQAGKNIELSKVSPEL